VLAPLRAEGVTDLEVVGVLTNHSSWDFEWRPADFDVPTFPLLLDASRQIFELYGASSYEMIYVDRKQRLVAKEIFESSNIAAVKQRLRELHAE